jgi:hypothetical protein
MSTQTISAMRRVRPVNNGNCNLLFKERLQKWDSDLGLFFHRNFHNHASSQKITESIKYSS